MVKLVAATLATDGVTVERNAPLAQANFSFRRKQFVPRLIQSDGFDLMRRISDATHADEATGMSDSVRMVNRIDGMAQGPPLRARQARDQKKEAMWQV